MEQPTRIQRKRTKGWKMPKNTVYVGRPTKWGNPFPVTQHFNRAEAFKQYCLFVDKWDLEEDAKKELKGKNLACWCKVGELCHADVLLQIANS
jgi:hypothetical protein